MPRHLTCERNPRMEKQLESAQRFLAQEIGRASRIAMITGTGLNAVTEALHVDTRIPYAEIPHFPVSTTEGHRGTLAVGTFAGKRLIALEGRFHLYEGYSAAEIALPIRVMRLLGVTHLFISSAAGGLNPGFNPGDLMLITDHINLTGKSPLTGLNLDTLGPRFPDLTRAYAPDLRRLASAAALQERMELQKGVYAAVHGPHLETPSETRFLRLIGGDAVGMSTVMETIAAVHCGLKVLAIAVIANVNRPDLMEEISLDDVIARANQASPKLARLWGRIMNLMEEDSF